MDSNEVVKQEKKKHGKNIVIIILVFVIALLLGIIIGQFALDNNSKKTDDNNTSKVTKKDNTISKDNKGDNTRSNTDTNNNTSNSVTKDNTNTNNSTTAKDDTNTKPTLTEEDIVKNLFISHLKKSYGDNLTEYKINKITIYKGTERKDLADIIGDVADSDILTLVDYSIKLNDVSKDAGNGNVSGNWVNNKVACVQIGYDVNGYSILDVGTGW